MGAAPQQLCFVIDCGGRIGICIENYPVAIVCIHSIVAFTAIRYSINLFTFVFFFSCGKVSMADGRNAPIFLQSISTWRQGNAYNLRYSYPVNTILNGEFWENDDKSDKS